MKFYIYVQELKDMTGQIETDFTEEEIWTDDEKAGFTKLLQVIYKVAKDATTIQEY